MANLSHSPLHVIEEIELATHPSGKEFMNVHCDCGERSGWTSDPVEAWDAQAMHELTVTPPSSRRIVRRSESSGLEIGI